jgi:hypothetical protein
MRLHADDGDCQKLISKQIPGELRNFITSGFSEEAARIFFDAGLTPEQAKFLFSEPLSCDELKKLLSA